MSKERKEEVKEGLPEWMATYGDLVTLLMCFFVLLFAFSEIDAQKFEQVMQSFQGSAGILESGKSLTEDELVFDAMPEDQVTETEAVQTDLQKLKETLEQVFEDIQEELKEQNIEFNVSLEINQDQLLIRFDDNVFFDSGKADIKPEANLLLDSLADIFSTDEYNTYFIKIEGHTDNVPINTSRFPSNWELSFSRSGSVIRYFEDKKGIEGFRLSGQGYGENRPVATNDTVEGRQQNRRVEFVVIPDTLDSDTGTDDMLEDTEDILTETEDILTETEDTDESNSTEGEQ